MADPSPSLAARIQGPVVPLNICFTESGQVDLPAMRRYADWLCAQRVPVLLLTYGSSEYAWLSDDDIHRLTAAVAETVGGRSVFITSSSFWPPKVCREFLHHAEACGADAVKVQINLWAMAGAGPQRRELFLAYYDQIGEGSTIPLLLWCNSAGGEPLPVDLVAEMARRARIVGLKNDDHPFYYYYDLCRATQGLDFAVISGGQMRNFVLGHQLGSTAYLCTTAPFRPDVALAFCEKLTMRDYPGAWDLVRRYEDPWLQEALQVGWLRAIKTAIHLRGLLPSDRVGGTWKGSSPQERDRVRACLEEVFGPIAIVDL